VIEKRRFTTNFFVAFVDDANISIDGGETVKCKQEIQNFEMR